MKFHDDYGRGMLLLYDDECYYCTRFAFFVHRLYTHLGYRMVPLGLYSREGYKVKSLLYEHTSNPDRMFWLVQVNPDDIKAYGGRVALFRLAIELIKGIACKRSAMDGGSGNAAATHQHSMKCSSQEAYTCMGSASVRCSLLSRIASLLVNGEKIIIATEEHKN